MRVIIDTNIFVMTLTSRSPYHIIYQALIAQQYSLIVSTEILLEYQEIISLKYGQSTTDFFLQMLDELPNIIFVTPFLSLGNNGKRPRGQ
jgi:predicted nucleic acid-binding protein